MTKVSGIFMSKKPSAIIFDLDGTLVDSARDLSGALNHVLRQSNRPEIELSRVRHMVGDGAKALIIKGFSETGPLPDEDDLTRIWHEFMNYYANNITKETIVFPGARNAIEQLARLDIPMGLCTNKVLSLTEKLMSEIELSDYFSTIVGGDSFEYQKPDARHITSTLDQMNCSAERAIMVGDSANDIFAAKNAKIPVIGVSFGYTKTPLTELNPDIIIDHYDDFMKAVVNLSDSF